MCCKDTGNKRTKATFITIEEKNNINVREDLTMATLEAQLVVFLVRHKVTLTQTHQALHALKGRKFAQRIECISCIIMSCTATWKINTRVNETNKCS